MRDKNNSIGFDLLLLKEVKVERKKIVKIKKT